MDRVIYVKLRGFLATLIMAFITRLLRVLWDLGPKVTLGARLRPWPGGRVGSKQESVGFPAFGS